MRENLLEDSQLELGRRDEHDILVSITVRQGLAVLQDGPTFRRQVFLEHCRLSSENEALSNGGKLRLVS